MCIQVEGRRMRWRAASKEEDWIRPPVEEIWRFNRGDIEEEETHVCSRAIAFECPAVCMCMS